MEKKIIYTHNKNGYVKIRDGNIILEIPFYLKWDKKFEETLTQKGIQLLEKQKKYNHVNVKTDESILLFGENIDLQELGKNTEKEIKQILLDYIIPIVDEYSQKIGIPYKSIRVGKAKTKRGSCSFDQKLMFNINLVHLPTKYIRYVIIHEICHLKHKNHSQDFWAEVENFLPSYRQVRRELKKLIINNE